MGKRVITAVLCLMLVCGTGFALAGCREENDGKPYKVDIEIYTPSGELMKRSKEFPSKTHIGQLAYTGGPQELIVKFHLYTQGGKDKGYYEKESDSRLRWNVKYEQYLYIGEWEGNEWCELKAGTFPTEKGSYTIIASFNYDIFNNPSEAYEIDEDLFLSFLII